jgi:drug/metabolite transporter (DMT)-like permease
LTRRQLLGIALALAGVLVVMGLDTLLAVEWRGHLRGDFLVFVSIVLWGLFTVAGKRMTDQIGALEMTGAATIIGALCMLPVGAAEMAWRAFPLAAIGGQAWLAIAFLGVTCSFAATLLYFAALARSESQKVGVYLYLIPPMTYVVAGLYLGEPIGVNLLAGSLLVLGGVYLTEKS